MLTISDPLGLVEAMLDNARRAADADRYAETIEHLITILSLEPDNADAHLAFSAIATRLALFIVAHWLPEEKISTAPIVAFQVDLEDSAAFVRANLDRFNQHDFFSPQLRQHCLIIARSCEDVENSSQAILSRFLNELSLAVELGHKLIKGIPIWREQ